MKNIISLLFLYLIIAFGLQSCSKDEDLEAGKVTLDFEHIFGSDAIPFSLNKEFTHPILGEKMTFTTMKYYVSNIRLKSETGDWTSIPETYYIVDAGNPQILEIPNVPGGSYTDIEVMYGVDSLRNQQGAQTGALDPAQGMFWSWNNGYIMVKTEGDAPTASDGKFAFHLGGYTGNTKCQTIKQYSFGNTLTVNGNRTAEVHFVTDIAKIWQSADKLAVRSKQHMPGAVAKNMTTDFYGGIQFEHIHN